MQISEHEILVESGNVTLKGTLCLPDDGGPFPVLLYVSGSGPLDRDENSPSLRLNNSKRIAHSLARLRIASMRYDKRGVGESGGDFLSASHSDLLNDAVACVQSLQKHDAINAGKVFVAGHSEGALIAAQVAARLPEISGIILLSLFCESMESLLIRQAEALGAMTMGQKGLGALPSKVINTLFNPVKAQRRLIERVRRSERPIVRFVNFSGLQKIPAKWLRELLLYDIESIYREFRVPALVVGGAKDFQCRPCDIPRIAEIYGGEAESHIVENMSHLLREELAEPPVYSYSKQLEHSLMPEALELIEHWLERRL